MKKILSVFVIFSLLGCVTAESVKSLSDYELCFEHSKSQFSEAEWQIYDNEVMLRDSLNCNTHAKAIEEEKERERKRSEALNELADTFKEINANKSGTNTQNKTTASKTNLRSTYKLERTYISGYKRVCIYSNGRERITESISSYSNCQQYKHQ